MKMPFKPLPPLDPQQEHDLEVLSESRHPDAKARAAKISVCRGLKLERSRLGISQSAMAELMGVSKRSYIDYEVHGRAVPSAALSALTAQTGVDMNQLFFGEEAPVKGWYRERTYKAGIRALDTLRRLYPDIDASTLHQGAAAWCYYAEPDQPLDEALLKELMEAIFYRQFKEGEAVSQG